ncbi:hypothetical protein A4A49_18925 [Nicotiana attenuata]|uniref:Uncharacterized protein n=1 Tax=Nicotiana attenuata TaxID=49451 RepID=A0A314KIJ2_NICAT|nr:hypothetical protein A4A49_18925 [Nicotiana attenuata]
MASRLRLKVGLFPPLQFHRRIFIGRGFVKFPPRPRVRSKFVAVAGHRFTTYCCIGDYAQDLMLSGTLRMFGGVLMRIRSFAFSRNVSVKHSFVRKIGSITGS